MSDNRTLVAESNGTIRTCQSKWWRFSLRKAGRESPASQIGLSGNPMNISHSSVAGQLK
jgi:hypothetical protein